jgi:hypothetical protein
MKISNKLLILFSSILIISCGSIKSTLKNVDNNAKKPNVINEKFVITEKSDSDKYGYDSDYPINIGFDNEKYAPNNVKYFFNALLGKNGETFTYNKIENCCPFPTKRTSIGVGTLDIYEITFDKTQKKIKLYFNIYEKGKIVCPTGFSIKTL